MGVLMPKKKVKLTPLASVARLSNGSFFSLFSGMFS